MANDRPWLGPIFLALLPAACIAVPDPIAPLGPGDAEPDVPQTADGMDTAGADDAPAAPDPGVPDTTPDAGDPGTAPDDGGPPDSELEDSAEDVPDAGVDLPEDSGAPAPDGPLTYCEPGEARCLTELIAQRCHESGDYYLDEVCQTGTRCFDGDCLPIVCEPGEPSGFCAGPKGPGVCNDTGTAFVPDPCPPGHTCFEGECADLVCLPGSVACWSMTAIQTCSGDGSGWAVTAFCEGGGMCKDGACIPACTVAAEARRTLGCELLAVTLPAGGAGSTLLLAAPLDGMDATVKLEDAATGAAASTSPLVVAAGAWALLPLPPAKNALRLLSDVPVSVQQAAPAVPSPPQDSSLLIPVHALGTEHIAVAWPAQYVPGGLRHGTVTVVPSEAGTTNVSFLPRVEAVATDPAGTTSVLAAGKTAAFALQGGQVLRFRAGDVDGLDLTGAFLASDRPVAVFTSHECARVPAKIEGCSHLQEQLPAVPTWGKTVVAVPYEPRSDSQFDIWRVVSGADANTVTTTPPQGPYGSVTLAKGAFVTFHANEAFVIEGTGPIMAVHVVTGAAYPGHAAGCGGAGPGDPAMSIVPSTAQFSRRAVIAAVPGLTSLWLDIVAPAAAKVSVNGVAPAAAMAVPIGTSGFLLRRVPLSPGSHTVAADQPVGATMHGYGCQASAAAPAGYRLEDLSPPLPAWKPPPPPLPLMPDPDDPNDSDGDFITDGLDNCPDTPNPGQANLDGDWEGDACDDDMDGDGSPNFWDCAPKDQKKSPIAPEICDGEDNDCDGEEDPPGSVGCELFYTDLDGDGAGEEEGSECLCAAKPPYTTPFGGDCADDDPATHPFAPEKCDGADNNCNGLADEGCDDDGDGWCDAALSVSGTPAVCPKGGGDCVDESASVSPGTKEVLGNGVDDDCDGLQDNQVPVSDCGAGAACTGESPGALQCALDACYGPSVVLGVAVSSPTGTETAGMFGAFGHFGLPGNDLFPRAGPSFLVIETGLVGTTGNDVEVGGSAVADPYAAFPHKMYDSVEVELTLKAPLTAKGLRFDSVFLSSEYEEKVGKAASDKFYAVMTAPVSTGGLPKVVNFGPCVEPDLYSDTTVAGKPACFIGPSSAFGEPCSAPETDISGTGYECGGEGPLGGSSTGWLRTTVAVQPGEQLTLTFHVHDTQSGGSDSAAIIDNVTWLSEAGSTGTVKQPLPAPGP